MQTHPADQLIRAGGHSVGNRLDVGSSHVFWLPFASEAHVSESDGAFGLSPLKEPVENLIPFCPAFFYPGKQGFDFRFVLAEAGNEYQPEEIHDALGTKVFEEELRYRFRLAALQIDHSINHMVKLGGFGCHIRYRKVVFVWEKW